VFWRKGCPPNSRSLTFASLRKRSISSNEIRRILPLPFVALRSRLPKAVLSLGTDLGTVGRVCDGRRIDGAEGRNR
jgi:hypothetical protein